MYFDYMSFIAHSLHYKSNLRHVTNVSYTVKWPNVANTADHGTLTSWISIVILQILFLPLAAWYNRPFVQWL